MHSQSWRKETLQPYPPAFVDKGPTNLGLVLYTYLRCGWTLDRPSGSLAKAVALSLSLFLHVHAVCMREKLQGVVVVVVVVVESCATGTNANESLQQNENHRHRASNSMCNTCTAGWGMTHMAGWICEVEAVCQTLGPHLFALLLVQAE